jgi:hypothetical protein
MAIASGNKVKLIQPTVIGLSQDQYLKMTHGDRIRKFKLTIPTMIGLSYGSYIKFKHCFTVKNYRESHKNPTVIGISNGSFFLKITYG